MKRTYNKSGVDDVGSVVCKPVLNYGGEVWACSSKTDEQRLERIQNRAGRRFLGLSWRFHGVVVRGELSRLEKTEV